MNYGQVAFELARELSGQLLFLQVLVAFLGAWVVVLTVLLWGTMLNVRDLRDRPGVDVSDVTSISDVRRRRQATYPARPTGP